jgi:hypothetical protein
MPPSVAPSQLPKDPAHAIKEPPVNPVRVVFLDRCCTNNTQVLLSFPYKPLFIRKIPDRSPAGRDRRGRRRSPHLALQSEARPSNRATHRSNLLPGESKEEWLGPPPIDRVPAAFNKRGSQAGMLRRFPARILAAVELQVLPTHLIIVCCKCCTGPARRTAVFTTAL